MGLSTFDERELPHVARGVCDGTGTGSVFRLGCPTCVCVCVKVIVCTHVLQKRERRADEKQQRELGKTKISFLFFIKVPATK